MTTTFGVYQVLQKYQYKKNTGSDNNAVLLSTARVIKVSALYFSLPFLFPSTVTLELTTIFEYLRNIISRDNTIGLQKNTGCFSAK